MKKLYNNRRSRKRARYTHKKYYSAVPVSQIRKKNTAEKQQQEEKEEENMRTKNGERGRTKKQVVAPFQVPSFIPLGSSGRGEREGEGGDGNS